MFLSVDLTEWVIMLINSLTNWTLSMFYTLDDIILVDGTRFGLNFSASVFDFCVGTTLLGIILGAFIHINRAHNYFYD